MVTKPSMTTMFTILVFLLILLLPSLTFSSLQNEDDRNVIAVAPGPANCISYDSSERTITITCKATHLRDIYNQIRDRNILDKQSNGIWLLNTNLTIEKGATLIIDPTDTT